MCQSIPMKTYWTIRIAKVKFHRYLQHNQITSYPHEHHPKTQWRQTIAIHAAWPQHLYLRRRGKQWEISLTETRRTPKLTPYIHQEIQLLNMRIRNDSERGFPNNLLVNFQGLTQSQKRLTHFFPQKHSKLTGQHGIPFQNQVSYSNKQIYKDRK